MVPWLTIALIVLDLGLLGAVIYYPKKLRQNICRDINLDLVLERNPKAKSLASRIDSLERRDENQKLQLRMLGNRIAAIERKLDRLLPEAIHEKEKISVSAQAKATEIEN
jgi:hypothetical protein